MIRIEADSKVYVFCPSGIVTGGAELLHQLVDTLNSRGIPAYIVYFGKPPEIPTEYRNYNIRLADKIEESSSNVVVVYEGIFDKIKGLQHVQLLFWWLSVDHFYIYSKRFLKIRDYLEWSPAMAMNVIFYRLGHLLLRRTNFFRTSNLSIRSLRSLSALHCYQSEYAQYFLLKNGFHDVLPLTDYINTAFNRGGDTDASLRDNIVLYNPKKGFAFTKKIMKRSPSYIKWIPLQGMDRSEMIRTFGKAKLYIDFGYHPGKDRIPREAALNGCCIITGRRGSANFFEDVPIPICYKVDEKSGGAERAIEKIEDTLKNYEERIKDFDFYRDRLMKEESDFRGQVQAIFRKPLNQNGIGNKIEEGVI